MKEKNQFVLSSQSITSGQIVGSKYFENNCSDISEIIIIIIIMTANVLKDIWQRYSNQVGFILSFINCDIWFMFYWKIYKQKIVFLFWWKTSCNSHYTLINSKDRKKEYLKESASEYSSWLRLSCGHGYIVLKPTLEENVIETLLL